MATITFDTLKFVAEAMDSQLATRTDLMEMENRLIKWGIGLALGQIAIIAALVKLL